MRTVWFLILAALIIAVQSAEGLKRRKRDWVIPPISIPENNNGPFPQKIAQVRASRDQTKTVTYSITGQGADQNPLNIFMMDKDTGDLYVTQRLDREKQGSYILQVNAVAEDGTVAEEPIEIFINVIDMNDNKPVFTEAVYAGEVVEFSQTGTEVIQVNATDLDEYGSDNSIIRYTIESQEPQQPKSSMFIINPETGVISVAASGLDSQKYPQYTLEVEAADMRGDGFTGRAKVVLNVTKSLESVPVIDQVSTAERLKRRRHCFLIPPPRIVENHNGPYPLKLKVVDMMDLPDNISYKITGCGSDQNLNDLFVMDMFTGYLYVTQPLDREECDRYRLVFYEEEDGSNAHYYNEYVVKVIDENDNKPVFTEDVFIGEVPENSPIGFSVLQVHATDLDDNWTPNAIIRYSILSQNPQEPSPSMFTINPSTGVIMVNATELDKEKYPQYILEVKAADMDGKGFSTTATVNITIIAGNYPGPVFSRSYYMTVVKENVVGALVLDIIVTDGEEPPTSAKFKIVSGDPDGLFSVKTADDNKHRGIITTAKALDFERNRTHTLLVTVEKDITSSIPFTTSTATVLVNVLDVVEPPVQSLQPEQTDKHRLFRDPAKRTGLVMMKKSKRRGTPLLNSIK